MSEPDWRDRAAAQPPATLTLYWIERRLDAWFIQFDGDEFGPYRSEREALLFAVDAARNLGEQGRLTQVLVADEAGKACRSWTYGHDRYPPR